MQLRQAAPMGVLPGYGDAVDIIAGRAVSNLAANSTATASTTGVATGHQISFTPSGIWLQIHGTLTVQNNTAAGTTTVKLYRTNGSAPAAGAAFGAGDTCIFSGIADHAVANGNQQVGLDIIDQGYPGTAGLTPGNQYTYYVVLVSDNGAHQVLEVGNSTLPNSSSMVISNT